MSYGDRIRQLHASLRGLDEEPLTNDDSHLLAIVDEVMAERLRQQEMRPADYDLTANDWVALLTAYAGRAAVISMTQSRTASQQKDFRLAMLKVAALSLAAIQAADKAAR